MNDITRRSVFLGLGGLLVSPAIVRASSLMKLPPHKPEWQSYWMWPAGLVQDMNYISPTLRYRDVNFTSYQPDEVARHLVAVQPEDSGYEPVSNALRFNPQPYFDIYKLTQPSPEYPNGRTIQIILPETEIAIRLGINHGRSLPGRVLDSPFSNLYELTRPTPELPFGNAVEIRVRAISDGRS